MNKHEVVDHVNSLVATVSDNRAAAAAAVPSARARFSAKSATDRRFIFSGGYLQRERERSGIDETRASARTMIALAGFFSTRKGSLSARIVETRTHGERAVRKIRGNPRDISTARSFSHCEK